MKALLLVLIAATWFYLLPSAPATDDPCIEIAASGVTELGFPVAITIEGSEIVSGGALPFPFVVGEYGGTLASAVTGQSEDEDGTMRLSLVHFFDAGDHGFWTEDEAECVPAGDGSAVCELVTEIRITGGSGDFAGASGWIRNEGMVEFIDPTLQTSPYGTLHFDMAGEVCAPGL